MRLTARFLTIAVAATAVGGGFGATALAAGRNHVHATAPADVKVSDPTANCQNQSASSSQCHFYKIKIKGHSAVPARIDFFLDYLKCGATPKAELAHSITSRTSEYHWPENGTFKRVAAGWYSTVAGTDHACVYLVKRNTHALLAHSFVAYTVR